MHTQLLRHADTSVSLIQDQSFDLSVFAYSSCKCPEVSVKITGLNSDGVPVSQQYQLQPCQSESDHTHAGD